MSRTLLLGWVLAVLPPACARAGEAWAQLEALAGVRPTISAAGYAAAPAPLRTKVFSPIVPVHERNVLPERLGSRPLIVVHATRAFDEDKTAAAGVDAAIKAYKAQGRPVVYLVDRQDPEGYAAWYTQDRRPDYELFSEGGEHNLPMEQDEVTIVGGFFGSYDGHRGCQTLAARDAIRMHFERSARPFAVLLPVRALYFYEEDASTREKLLKLDAAKASPAELSALFDDFAELFFLTDNFSEVPAFGHPYLSGSERRNKTYRDGASVDVDGYTFELSFNGKPVARFGHGPRRVSLKLSNESLD